MAGNNLGSVAEGMTDQTLNQQQVMLNQFKLADAPVTLEEDRIKLQQDKLNLAKQTRMLQLMQGLHPGQGTGDTPSEMADLLNQLSVVEMESGNPDEAAKMAGDASRLTENASKVDYRTYRMQNDRMTKFSNVLSSVPDSPAGWQMAIQEMSTDPSVMKDQKFQALAKQPWKPGLIKMLQGSVQSAKDKSEIAYREAATKNMGVQLRNNEARTDLIKAQTKLDRDRDNAIRANGGKPPTAAQLQTITDQALRDYPSADPADVRTRSRPLAEEMLAMMRDTPSLTQSQASVRVYEAARSRGDFNGLRPGIQMKGTKPGNPTKISPEQAKKMKAGSYQQNQWYVDPTNFGDSKPRLIVGDKAFTEEEMAEQDQARSDDSNAEDDEDAD